MTPGGLDNLGVVIDGRRCRPGRLRSREVEASDVDEQAWGRFVHFTDPDGNRWTLQQLPDWSPRLGGDGVNPAL